MLQATRQAMDGTGDGRKYELTIAASSHASKISALRLPELDAVLNYIFVMTYDYDRGLGKTWHNQNLFPSQKYALADVISADTGMKAYREGGFPSRKLVFGLPLYGYAYQGVSKGDGLLEPNSNSAAVTYIDILEKLASGSYTRYEDEEAMAGWIYSSTNGELITYTDKKDLRSRVEYVNQNDLGGFMFWHLSSDSVNPEESLTIQASNMLLGNDRSSFKKRSVCAPLSEICSIRSKCSPVKEELSSDENSATAVFSATTTIQGLVSLAIGGVALAVL